MHKVLIAYGSRTGETENIAGLIAEGLRFSGAEVTLKKVTEIKSKEDLEGYDAVVLGSPTYHGEMIQGMKTLLFLAEQADLTGTVGAAFGAFGWSGEAPERIFGTMANIFKMDMVGAALMLKSSALGGGIQMAQDYGRQIAKKLAEKEEG